MKILILTEFFPEGQEPVFTPVPESPAIYGGNGKCFSRGFRYGVSDWTIEKSRPSGREVLTGGVEARVFHLIEFLKKRHEVNVIWRTANYSFNSVAAVAGRAAFFLSQLIKIILCAGKYDIVEGTNFVTYILAFLYAKRTGAKAVAWYPDVFIGHGVERLGLVSGMAAELAERLTIKLSWDGVVALSQQTKTKLIQAGVSKEKMEVIYGGVGANHKSPACISYAESIAGREIINHKFKKYEKPTIICIARLVKYKRVGDLLLAVYFLRERFKDIRVIIVGDGPELSRLQAAGCRLQVADRIRFSRGVSEKEKLELLARAHIHVLPSVVEGFGLVTMESLASGTPIVNADIPINREILQKEEARLPARQGRRKKEEGNAEDSLVQGGLLFRVGDAVDLAEKIELLLTDKEFYNQKVKEGMELVKRYEWEKVNRQTEKFYQRLLSD